MASTERGTEDARGSRAPFVGRTREVDRLRTAFGEARSGRGRALFVGGEPGIGKTRLAEEFAAEVQERGAIVLWGRCLEAEGVSPFWPWVQIIRSYVELRDTRALRTEMGMGAADIAQVVPEVRARLADFATPASLEPAAARFRFFDAVVRTFQRATQRAPILLGLDDLHAADRPSLLLLQFLVRELAKVRMLVVGTYRDVGLGRHHPLAEALAELGREPATERITIRGLAEEDVASYLVAVAGRPVPREIARAVSERTEGNPFFLRQVADLLAAEGAFERSDDHPAPRLAIPEGVREAVGRRLARLSTPCDQVLQAASVMGREFDLSVLGRVIGLAGDELLAALDEAVTAGILSEVDRPLGRYRFTHTLIRETLHDELTSPQRALLHRRIGGVLEEISVADPRRYLADLAYHFFEAARAGNAEKAVDYAVGAARLASERLAYEEAAAQYERALQTCALLPDGRARECELLLLQGEAQSRAGEVELARETFLRAAEAARRHGTPEQLAQAAMGFAGGWEWWQYDERIVRLLEEALAAIGPSGSPLHARVLARLALSLHSAPDRARQASLAERAEAIARAVGDPLTLAHVLSAKLLSLSGPDLPPRRALALVDEVIALARAAGDGELLLLRRLSRVLYLLHAAEVEQADRELTLCQGLVEELRQPVYAWRLSGARALIAYLQGDLARAGALSEEGFELGRRLRRDVADAIYLPQQLFLSRFRTTDLGGMEPRIRAVVSREPRGAPAFLATLYLALGRIAEARQQLSRAVDAFVAMPRDGNWLFNVALLGEACARLDERHHAAVLYDVLLPYADSIAIGGAFSPSYSIGAVARVLGLLASSLGRESLDALFEDALRRNARLGLAVVVRTQLDHAAALVRRGRGADRERAIELARRAYETASALGMDVAAQEAGELLAAAGAERASAARRPPVTVRCLGGSALRIGEEDVDLGTLRPRERALLEVLALNAGRALHREVILELLWPGAAPRSGMRSLHTAISSLRRLLDRGGDSAASLVRREGEAYRLALPAGSDVDVLEFDTALRRADVARRSRDRDRAIAELQRGLDLYGGDVLPASGPAEWVVEERERRRAQAAEAATSLADLLEQRGDHLAAASACERGLAIDRYRDRLWQLLAAAYEHTGNAAAAARARQEYAEALQGLGAPSA